jgi:putative ABC transport system permease protein
MNFLKRAVRSLWARKARTLIMLVALLAISSMTLGASLIDDATSRAGQAAQDGVGAEADLSLDINKLMAAGGGQGGLSASQQLESAVADKLGDSPVVESYNYTVSDGVHLLGGTKIVSGTSAQPGDATFLPLQGVLNSARMPGFQSGQDRLVAGRGLDTSTKNLDDVLVEQRFATQNNLHVGDKIRLGADDPGSKAAADFTVVGIYSDSLPTSQSDPDTGASPANGILAAIGGLAKLNGEIDNGSVRINTATFQLKSPGDLGALSAQAAHDGLDTSIYDLTLNDKAYQQMTGPINSVASTTNLAKWLIAIAGAAVLGLLVALTVRQRRREFGILLAMGERKWKLVAQLLVETAALAIVAVGLSAFFAPSLTQSAGDALLHSQVTAAQQKIDDYVAPPAGSTGVNQGTSPDSAPVAGANPIDKIHVSLDAATVGEVAGVGLGIAILAAAIPAVSAIRLTPRTILTKGK